MKIAGLGAAIVGIAGFCAGFFGPIALNPDANQGPLVGIFITGPGGALFGLILGAILGYLGVERTRSVKILSGAAALLVAGTLIFCLPKPRYLGNLVSIEVAKCEPPSAMKTEAIAHWEKRVAAVTWAEPRSGWKESFDAMAELQPGVVLTVAVAKSAGLYENRKPWNRGTPFAGTPHDVQTRYFLSRGSCAVQTPGTKGVYATGGETPSKAWPTDELATFLGLQSLKPVHEDYRGLLQ